MFALALTGGLLSGCPGDDSGSVDRAPYRDAWQTVIDQDFIHTGSDGVAQIFQLSIGRREYSDNFANRGDVIVNFDGPADRILVEFRKFTFSPDEGAAQSDFDALSVWSYAGESTPKPPSSGDLEVEDNCIESGWQNDCEVLVYYDGLSQLRRSGSDIRVTLPADYRQSIDITTQDNVEDPDYFNRGNVCVSNLFASADIEAEAGNIWVQLARDAYPSPKCSPEQIQGCEDWMADDGTGNMVPAPWAPECPCINAGGGEFGLLTIDNTADAASDITIDIPSGLWSSINAQNKGESQEAAGDHCTATVSVPNALEDETGNDFPWQAKYNANYPGEPAIRGAGFTIQAASNSCGPVAFTEDPADFVGVGLGKEQDSAKRGAVEVCSDCIVQSCNELIP